MSACYIDIVLAHTDQCYYMLSYVSGKLTTSLFFSSGYQSKFNFSGQTRDLLLSFYSLHFMFTYYTVLYLVTWHIKTTQTSTCYIRQHKLLRFTFNSTHSRLSSFFTSRAPPPPPSLNRVSSSPLPVHLPLALLPLAEPVSGDYLYIYYSHPFPCSRSHLLLSMYLFAAPVRVAAAKTPVLPCCSALPGCG